MFFEHYPLIVLLARYHLSPKITREILKRVTIIFCPFPSSPAGITFRELMSTIFHAQDPRNRRVKWFAVNLSSTRPSHHLRETRTWHLSHSIFHFCTSKGKGRGMKLYSLLYIWKGTAVWTPCFFTWRLFSALACQKCIRLLTLSVE